MKSLAFTRCQEGGTFHDDVYPHQLHAVPLAELQPDPTQPRIMIMETLTSLKNTLEEALAGASKPSNNLA